MTCETTSIVGSKLAGRDASGRLCRWHLFGAAAALCLFLVACGGGGGGDGASSGNSVSGPPTAAATLSASNSEAQAATPGVLAAADAAAARVGEMSGFGALMGGTLFPQSTDDADRRQIQSIQSPSMHPLAVETASCRDLMDSPSCTGSATIDTNVSDNATRVVAGDYADISFASLSGRLSGMQVSLNGRMRIDFNSTLRLDSSTFSGLDITVTFQDFSGSVNGVTFGPVSDMGRLQIDSHLAATLTTGGATYSGLRGVHFASAGSYTVGGGTARVKYWSDSGRYVDISFENWQVVNRRPAVGSRATVTAGTGSISVVATSSTATTVVYAVTISISGASTRYTVTATYPAGGGTPTYVAVLS